MDLNNLSTIFAPLFKINMSKSFFKSVFLLGSICFYTLAFANYPSSCPDLQKRNNGNGQYGSCASVNGTPICSNVVGTPYASVLTTNGINPSSKTGDLNFKWPGTFTELPVISRIWVGTTPLASIVGPPPVPTYAQSNTYARYCFYVANIPNAGVLTLEFTNPVTGLPMTLCSYDLQTGSPATTPSIPCNPVINTQPANINQCGPGNIIFGLKATGASSYNWQYQTPTGTTWANCSGVSDFTFTNDDTLRVANALTYNGYKFKCVLSNSVNSCGTTTSNTVTLNANPYPTGAFSGGSYLCGLGARNITTTFTGSAPWTFTYTTTPSVGSPSTSTVNNVPSSPYFLNVAPTVTTTYTITSIADKYCNNTSVSGVTITVQAIPTATLTSSTLSACNGVSSVNLAYSTTNSPDQYSISTGNRAMPGFTAVTNQTLSSSSGTITMSLPANIPAGTYDFYFSVKHNTSGCSSSLVPFTVTVSAKPNITAGANAYNVCPNASVTLSAAPSNLSSYSWSSSPSGFTASTSSTNATPSQNTTYTVIASDAYGCKDTASVTITTKTVGSISVNSPSICPNSAATLTASGASTYAWSPSTGLSATTGSSVVASPSSTTTYTVTGTFADGCSNTASAVVTVNNTITASINASSTNICTGGSATLTAALSSGSPDSVKWFPTTGLSASTGTTVTATPTSNITYNIQAYLNGCVYTASQAFTIVTSPKTSSTGRYLYYCQKDQSGTLSLSVNDSSTFAWYTCPTSGVNCTTALTTSSGYTVTPNSTSTKALSTSMVATSTNGINNSTQFYKLVITNKGCTFTEYMDLVQLGTTSRFDIIPDQTICSGNTPTTLQLNGSFNGSYSPQWKLSSTSATSGFGNISGATGTSYSPGALTATRYYRLYIPSFGPNVCNSADSSDVVTVTVVSTISNNTISVSNACSNAAPSITGSTPTGGSGFTYLWESAPDVSGTPGTWSTLAAGNGINYYGSLPITAKTWFRRTVSTSSCNNVSTALMLYPTVSGNEITANQQLCAGQTPSTLTGSTLSGGTGTYTYAWQEANDASGSPSTWNNISGASSATYSPGALSSTKWYRRNVTSGACASTSNEIKITVDTIPNVAISASTTQLCTGSKATLTATGATTYTWSSSPNNSSLSSTGGSPVVVNPTASTTYTVIGTDQNACSASASVSITVNALPSSPSLSTRNAAVCNPSGGVYDLNNLISSTAPSGVTYGWYTVNSNPSSTYAVSPTTVSNSGAYYVFAKTTATGCYSVYDSAIINITNLAAPTPLSTNISLCDPARADLNAYTPNAVSGSSYEWHTVASNPSGATLVANPSSVGNTSSVESFYLYAKSGTCYSSASARVDVTIHALPTLTLNSDSSAVCSPSTVNLNSSISSTINKYTYQWHTSITASPSNLVSDPTAAGAGWYYMFVTDSFGCKSAAVDSFKVTVKTKPVVSVTTPSIICNGSSVNISGSATGSGLSYQWYKLNPATNASNSLTNTNPYSGVTTTTLAISNTTGLSRSLFYLTASNGTCTIASDYTAIPMDTTVNITLDPIDVTALCNNCQAVFSATASVQSASAKWQVKENGSTWRDISSSGTDSAMYSGIYTPDLIVKNVQDSMNGYQYRYIVFNNCNTDTSLAATLFTLLSLPIHIVDFNATVVNQMVHINWQISGDDEVSHYILSSSKTGVKFTPIAQLNALRKDIAIQDYFSLDPIAAGEMKYYRLTVVELSGKAYNSHIISASNDFQSSNWKVLPNPIGAEQLKQVVVQTPVAINGQLNITDAAGKIVTSQNIDWQNGFHTIQLDPMVFKNGVYYIQLLSHDQLIHHSLKMVVVVE